MKLKYLILHLISIQFTIISHAEPSHENEANNKFDEKEEECEETFKQKIHPSNCCNYPRREIPIDLQEKCSDFCKEVKDESGGCCLINCNYERTGVYANGKFNDQSLLELYENYLDEHGGGKFDQWVEIVEDSIRKCRNLVGVSSQIYACDIPQYVMDIMDCVDHINFLNCPKFNKSNELCRELKNFIENDRKCGKVINGTSIIYYKFFEKKEK